MEIVPPEDIDPVWWAQKTGHTAEDYCPQCRPDVDPRDSHFVPCPCNAHRTTQGSADWQASQKRPEVLIYTAISEYL